MRTPSVFSFIFFLLLSVSAHGQIGDIIKQQSFQKKQKNVPPAISQIKQLAYSITINSNTETEKVAAIFNWVASNVVYDNELHYSEALQKKIYTTEENVILHVLKRKKALCGGFALLFEALCKEVGMQSKTIHGYTKNSITKKIPKQVNHSWNAVHINGTWKLLDITWAISHGSENSPNKFWFFTKPGDFIKTHFPQDSNWTLLQRDISKEAFFSKP